MLTVHITNLKQNKIVFKLLVIVLKRRIIEYQNYSMRIKICRDQLAFA